jgi:hypothetical protein
MRALACALVLAGCGICSPGSDAGVHYVPDTSSFVSCLNDLDCRDGHVAGVCTGGACGWIACNTHGECPSGWLCDSPEHCCNYGATCIYVHGYCVR